MTETLYPDGPGRYRTDDGFTVERAENAGPRDGRIPVWNVTVDGGGHQVDVAEGCRTLAEARHWITEARAGRA